ncbi:MAG: SpoIID/LytB domain-containing protein, partial [Candidatus Omnitrophota bacterium]
ASGGLLKIPANKLRSILGPNLIRSTNFRADIVGSDVVFEGLGWGHGVGMCQWGAYFMAKEGRDYKEILAYYYPGTKIKNINASF